MDDKIEIKLNYTIVFISYTLNFIVINLANLIFFYKVIMPYMTEKIKKILNVNIKKYYEYDENYKKEVKEGNKKYFYETFKCYLLLSCILVLINLFLYIKNAEYYNKCFSEYVIFQNIRNMIVLILFSLLIQFLFYKGFAFKYYLYIIYKYIFQILRIN